MYNKKYTIKFNRKFKDKEFSQTIECDNFNKVMGKVVTEEYLDDKKSIVKSFIIPISEVYEIKDGDITCI